MKKTHQLALSIIFLLVILLTPGAMRLNRTLAQSAASAPELQVAGLQKSVSVKRDERGIPYIEAANDHDLNFAQGYVTASDRLFQMDLLRRSARGELSEIFGPTALEGDKQHRVYGFAKLSEKSAAMLPANMRALVEAFADGVNAFIASRDQRTLPVEFRILKYRPRNWTAADSIIIGYLMAESLSTTWQSDLTRAAFLGLPKEQQDELFTEFSEIDTPVVGSDKKEGAAEHEGSETRKRASLNFGANHEGREAPEVLKAALESARVSAQLLDSLGLGAEDLAASNNWVVSGKRTATGKPLLANDPHLSPSAPSIWYLINLSAPGVRVAGVSIPGINGVIIGHNERIAWGMTNLAPDVQDLYREKFDGSRYETPSGWKEVEVRREEIKVRKTPTDPATDTINLDVTITRHGPVVLEKSGPNSHERYALKWTVLDPKLESVTAFYKLNRARDWKEFTSAISAFSGATQNYVYADVDGHIGYYGSGYIPIRKSGDGSVPYDGSKDDGEWTGLIPFDKLPHVFDPPSGVIVTANARVVGKDYPYFLTHAWSVPYRQKRINDLLAAKSKLTVEDFRATQADVYAIGGATFARAIVKLFGDKTVDPKFKESLKLLADWDGRATPDSRAALLVNEWRDIFLNRIVAAAIGQELAKQYRWSNRNILLDRIVADWPQRWLPKGTTWEELLIKTEADARASVAKKVGSQFALDESKWTYGNVAQIRFAHPLAVAPLVGAQFKIESFPQAGSGYTGGLGPTPNVGPSVSMRLIADLSNWDNTRHGITLGQSGDPQSPHYKDQLQDWRNVTPPAFPFTREAVSKATKSAMALTP